MNLIIDIGNSRIKLAVVGADGQVVAHESFEQFDVSAEELLTRWVAQYSIKHSILSSTRGLQSGIVEWLERNVGHCLSLDSSTAVPIANSYATPETLGRDRLAAAVGAQHLWSGRGDTFLIVDFGTAITIDLVTRDGGFEGGFISPGVSMRFAALHNYTASLPLCAATEVVDGIARTTRSAIEQGVMRGVCNEIESYVVQMKQKFGEIVVIFAGGDAKYFDMRIKNAIFAECDLVIAGLNVILNYENNKI